MKPNSLRYQIYSNLNAPHFKYIFGEQITDLLRQILNRKISNPLYNDSNEGIISWELRRETVNETIIYFNN